LVIFLVNKNLSYGLASTCSTNKAR